MVFVFPGFLYLFLCFNFTTGRHVHRQYHRKLGFRGNDEKHSFDGSLLDLYKAAMKKAQDTKSEETDTPISSPSKTPTHLPTVETSQDPDTLMPSVAQSEVNSKSAWIDQISKGPSSISIPDSDASSITNSSAPIQPDKDQYISCEESYRRKDEIPYSYSIEYEANLNLHEIIKVLEANLKEFLASIYLSCTPTSKGQLKRDIGLVALDAYPLDKVASKVQCSPSVSANACSVVEGSMRIFIALDAKKEKSLIENNLRMEIRNFLTSMQRPPGIFAIDFLGPNVTDIDEVKTASEKNSTASNMNIALSSQSIILYTLAGVAFLSSTGLAFWLRCTMQNKESVQNLNSIDLQLTQCDSQSIISKVDTTDNQSHDPMDRTSPLSAMLPTAYSLNNHHDGMSVILESRESSFYHDQGSSVFLSEGYSTGDSESDVEFSSFNFSNNFPATVLGALPRR